MEVLQKLQEPFEKPVDTKLWNSQLDNLKPSNLFMQLVDYSKDAQGRPWYDLYDNELYLVTEVAELSLYDYVKGKRNEGPPSKETVRNMAKAILLVMAGLHAKGFVHLDMKPENLMIFAGRLKLIDVDGCIEIGTHISLDDSSISFSLCYCAPEWAKALRGKGEIDEIIADPVLDAWSVGCTICELVTMDAILRPVCRRKGKGKFLDWLASLQNVPLPLAIEEFDSELVQLVSGCLLVCEPSKRRTCAQTLDMPLLATNRMRRTKSSPIKIQPFE